MAMCVPVGDRQASILAAIVDDDNFVVIGTEVLVKEAFETPTQKGLDFEDWDDDAQPHERYGQRDIRLVAMMALTRLTAASAIRIDPTASPSSSGTMSST